MARKIVHLPATAPEFFDTSDLGVAQSRVVAELIRDTIRTQLAPLGVKVSDIGTWNSSGSFYGWIFECHHAANNTSFYWIGGYADGGTAPDVDDYLGLNSTNLSTLMFNISSQITSAVGSAAGYALGVNPDTSISRANLDFNNATELTYTGGDWTTLTTLNLDSLAGIQALFPSHCTLALTDMWVSTSRTSRCLGYDDEEGVWLYATNDCANAEAYVMWGPLLDPSADANEYATLRLYGSRSATFERGIGHTYANVSAFDAGGTLRTYDLSPDNDLTINNYKVAGGAHDGKLNWKKVEVNNGSGGSGVKGYVKEEYFVEVGIFRDGTFFQRPIQMPDDAHPVVCMTESCAIWWEDGARLFPTYFVWNPDPYVP
jgi:hypothetical protein